MDEPYRGLHEHEHPPFTTPTVITIVNEPHISRLKYSCTMVRTIKCIPLWFFRIANKKIQWQFLNQKLFMWTLYNITYARQHQIQICLKIGFLSVHSSKGVLGTVLLGT